MQTYQSVIATLDRVLRAPVDGLDQAITTALGALCQTFDLHRAVLYMRRGDGLFWKAGCSGQNGSVDDSIFPASLTGDDLGRDQVPVPTDGRLFLRILDESDLNGALGVAPLSGHSISAEHTALLQFAADLFRKMVVLRESELLIAEKKRRHDLTLAALADEVFEVDEKGHLTGFLAGKPRLLIDLAGDATGQALRDVLDPVSFLVVDAALKDALQSGDLVTARIHKPGEYAARHYELTAQLVPSVSAHDAKQVRFVVCDVTGTANLRDDLTRMAKVVEAMDNLVAVLDPFGRVQWVNAAFEKQTGWTLPEIKGQRLGKVMRNTESDPETIAALLSKLEKAEPFRGEIVNQDRYGNSYWVDFNVVPLFDGAGALSGFVSIETVVTKLKQQEFATARSAAEAEAAHAQLQNAIEALRDSVVILDADKRIVAVNEAYRQSFPTLAPMAQPGRPFADLLRAGVEQHVLRNELRPEEIEGWVQDRLADYTAPQSETFVELGNGRWLHRRNTRTADGGAILLGVDVTESRQQLAALDVVNRELSTALDERDTAKQRLTSLILGAEVGTWEHDLQTDRLSFRGFAPQILGYEMGDLDNLPLGRFLELVHPDDWERLPPPTAFEISGGNTTVACEFRMRHRDGHWVWILSRGSVAQRSEDGTAIALSGVNIDISERKELETEISARRAFLMQVINASVSALVVLDVAGKIAFVNLEAARLLGGARDLIVGEPFAEVVLVFETPDGELLRRAAMPDAQVRRSQQPLRDFHLVLRLATGEKRSLLCNAAPLHQGDVLNGVVMAFSDITDDLAVTKRLEDALLHAEEMSRSKSIFLANMSHEIRTPLNGVLGMAEVLSDLVTEPAQKRMVTTIQKSGETLLTVLNSILDMSKIEAGRMDLEVVPFVPASLLRQLDAIYAIAAEEKGISFEILTSVGSDQPRLGDPHRLMQIFNNLLSNAIKFTDTGGVTLKLSCRRGKPVIIEVSDTGLGMDETQLARVFDSFEQADGSITRRFGGTGLGLSILRELVVLMGGEVTVESEVGFGSKFRVVLPLPDAEAADMPPVTPLIAPVVELPDSSTAQQPLTGRRVLCADDNATNRLVLSEMLAKSGLVLEFVEDGAKAVAAWTRAQEKGLPFDLLCLDITMPVMDGMTALAQIRATEAARDLPTVPAIAITANAMPKQVSEYIIGGFDTHLSKPFKQLDLLHAIDSLLAA